MKKIIFSKDFLLIFLIILLLISINIYSFFESTYYLNEVNAFSFWNYILHYGLGSLIMFLSPIFISYLTINEFAHKINGSLCKDETMRIGYKKMIKRNFISSYLKAIIPFLILYFVTFIIGQVLFSKTIIFDNYYDPKIDFYYDSVSSPYIFLLLSFISLIMYIINIANISLIILKKVKKHIQTILLTFLVINAINFIVGNTLIIISKIIGNTQLIEYCLNINFYEGYYVQSTILRSVLHTSIYFIIINIILYYSYRKKDFLGEEL
ncbi:MAG: hypothetical protein RSB77_01830 [Bacilli bacterium]